MDGLDTLYIEGGQTAVIDGVYLAAEHVANYKKSRDDDRRRRALIVVTDGEDRASYYAQEQLFRQLREQDVQIYVIGFVNELEAERGLIRKSPRGKAVDLLNKLATETGGRAFFPQSISDLPQIANEIVRDLRTQYVISYDPSNKTHDGTYRAIRVVVNQPTWSREAHRPDALGQNRHCPRQRRAADNSREQQSATDAAPSTAVNACRV